MTATLRKQGEDIPQAAGDSSFYKNNIADISAMIERNRGIKYLQRKKILENKAIVMGCFCICSLVAANDSDDLARGSSLK